MILIKWCEPKLGMNVNEPWFSWIWLSFLASSVPGWRDGFDQKCRCTTHPCKTDEDDFICPPDVSEDEGSQESMFSLIKLFSLNFLKIDYWVIHVLY